MKYAALALGLVFAIPGCSCLRKKDKQEKKVKVETKKAVKKAKTSDAKEHMDTRRY